MKNRNISFENISKVSLIGFLILFLVSEGIGIGLVAYAHKSIIVLEIIGFILIVIGLFPLFRLLDMIIIVKPQEEISAAKLKDDTQSIFSTEKVDDVDITARQQISNRSRY